MNDRLTKPYRRNASTSVPVICRRRLIVSMRAAAKGDLRTTVNGTVNLETHDQCIERQIMAHDESCTGSTCGSRLVRTREVDADADEEVEEEDEEEQVSRRRGAGTLASRAGSHRARAERRRRSSRAPCRRAARRGRRPGRIRARQRAAARPPRAACAPLARRTPLRTMRIVYSCTSDRVNTINSRL